MAKRIFMILIRANTERQIPVIRATLVSAPPSECLEIRLCVGQTDRTIGDNNIVIIPEFHYFPV